MSLQLVIHSEEQARRQFPAQVSPYVLRLLRAGKAVAVQVIEAEEAKSDKQRRFFHGVVLKEISEQVRTADGVRHAIPIWKEYFRTRYLGTRRVKLTHPLTGEVTYREDPVSTEDLSVRKYSALIEQVMAEAITDFHVQFSMPNWESYEAMQ